MVGANTEVRSCVSLVAADIGCMITTETLWFPSETAGFPSFIQVPKAGGSSMGEMDMAAPRRLRRATVVLACALGFACVVAQAAQAPDFVVTSTPAAPDAKPGDP